MEANALEQRQLLPGLGLGSIVQNAGSDFTSGLGLGSIVQNAGSDLTSGLGGVVGGLTSGLASVVGSLTSDLGAITSDIGQGVSTVLSPVLPTLTSITSSSSSSSSSSSIATSTTESLSSLSTPSVTLSLSSTTDSQSITETPLADSGTQTVTNFVSISPTPSSTPPAAAPKGFLQNKPLAGAVFGAVGLVVVVLIFIITTWALRRRRRKNLIEDAISFDPSEPHYNDGLIEKGRSSIGSDGLGRASNTSHGTYSQYPVSIPSNQGHYDARPPQPAQQPYPRYPSPTQMGNQAYDGIGGNGIYYSSTARNVLGSNPPALRDAGLTFQSAPQTQANSMRLPISTQLPSTFGNDGGRRSPDEALRGPALKVAS